MDIEWLSDFLSLANTQNFSTAAKSRHITQSAFSRRIQGLEYWLGVPLIDRSTFPATLTPAGEMFRHSADEIVRAIQHARDECRAEVRSDPSAVSFVALHTLSLTFFPQWIKGPESRLGPLHTRMQGHNLHDCIQLLITGNSSFLLCYAHPRGPLLLNEDQYPSLKLATESLMPVSAAKDDGSAQFTLSRQKNAIPYLGYSPDSFLGKMVEVILAKQDDPPKFDLRYENSMAEALKTMALEGHGIAWLPESCIKRELRNQNLVIIGNDNHRISMDIRIYRAKQTAKPEAERLWYYLLEQAT
ncbi:HTH-type transcriptional regulator YjiE [bacterium MnTg02]|nr:HTH-type transcriptional regulator YjiE [bacterium MnTg02]